MSTTTTPAPTTKPRARAAAKPSSSKAAKRRTAGDTRALVAIGIGYAESAKGRDRKAISQKPTTTEVAKAERVLRRMDGDTILAKLGGISETKLRDFVRGNITGRELGDAGHAAVKAYTKGIGSHQVWARKAAVMAYGLHIAAKQA